MTSELRIGNLYVRDKAKHSFNSTNGSKQLFCDNVTKLKIYLIVVLKEIIVAS